MPATLKTWQRRRAIGTAAILLISAGTVAASRLIDSSFSLVLTIVTVLGAALALFFTFRVTGLERDQEIHRGGLHTTAAVQPIAAVDPLLLGVTPARSQDALAGGRLPRYVPRDVDSEIQAKLEAAFTSDDVWFVLVVGRPKVGKSRSLFEALRAGEETKTAVVVAPSSLEALREITTPGKSTVDVPDRAVLWLGDIEDFTRPGLEMVDLTTWRSGQPGRIVVGTLGGRPDKEFNPDDHKQIFDASQRVLQYAIKIYMDKSTSAEVASLLRSDKIPLAEKEILESAGIGQWLTAVDRLSNRLMTSALPNRAIVELAATWAYCGRTDPIKLTVLRDLWNSYPFPGGPRDEDAFSAALAWASVSVSDGIALVDTTADGVKTLDLVVSLVTEGPLYVRPRDEMWTAALDSASIPETLAIAQIAHRRQKYEIAIRGYSRVTQHGGDRAAAVQAWHGMALVHYSQGDLNQELAIYDGIVSTYGNDTSPEVREHVAAALVNRGFTLGENGELAQELEAYDEVVTRFGVDDTDTLQFHVSAALINRAIALAEQGRHDQAVGSYDDVLARFGDEPSPVMRSQVAAALTYKGIGFVEQGLYMEAKEAFELVAVKYGDDPTPTVRAKVASSLRNKGIMLGEQGRHRDAIDIYDLVVAEYGSDTSPEARQQVASALVNKGAEFATQGQHVEAIEAYEEVISIYGQDAIVSVRAPLATALVNKGIELGHLNRLNEAIAAYDETVTRFLDDDAPGLRKKAVAALLNKGIALDGAERHDEAADIYRRIVAEFGEDTNSDIREYVAGAMVIMGMGLGERGQPEAAVKVLDELSVRLGSDPNPAIRAHIASGLNFKATTLSAMGSFMEALDVLDGLIARYGDDASPAVNSQVINAMANRTIALFGRGLVDEQAIAELEILMNQRGLDASSATQELVAELMRILRVVQKPDL